MKSGDKWALEFYRAWERAQWCVDPDCTGISCATVRRMYHEMLQAIPGRNLPRPITISERVLPKIVATKEDKVIHILTVHHLILGRCLQGAPHTWPANHWTVPMASGHNATCTKCLKLYKLEVK